MLSLLKQLLDQKIVWIVFVFNLTILLLHLFKASFVLIDNTTLLLMILLLLTPFARYIKRIKWGDFEAELTQEIKQLKEDAKEAELNKSLSSQSLSRASDIQSDLKDLSIKDPTLALAKLRFEIETKLKRLFPYKENGAYGIRNMTQTLAGTGVIDNKLRNIILNITGILNRIVHGDGLPDGTSVESVLEVGIQIMTALDEIYYKKLVEPNSEEITKRELKELMKAKYEVITVVPITDGPYKNTRVLNQEQLDQFLDGYDEYGEFLIEIKKL